MWLAFPLTVIDHHPLILNVGHGEREDSPVHVIVVIVCQNVVVRNIRQHIPEEIQRIVVGRAFAIVEHTQVDIRAFIAPLLQCRAKKNDLADTGQIFENAQISV